MDQSFLYVKLKGNTHTHTLNIESGTKPTIIPLTQTQNLANNLTVSFKVDPPDAVKQ